MDKEDTWWTVVAVACGVAFVVLVSFVVHGCDGTRGPTLQSNEVRVRTLIAVGPLGVRPHELTYMAETLEAHLAVVDRHRAPSMVALGFFRLRVVFYRTSAALSAKRYATPGAQVFLAPTSFQGQAAQGFLINDEIHVYAGTKWQAPGLSHMLWHVYEFYALNDHTDLRWALLDVDCGVTSNFLWASR